MTRQLPEGWNARYDYHEHPRGLSAIVTDDRGKIVSVGFAKFNPRDGQFDYQIGRRIALGRALKAAQDRGRTRWFFADGTVLDGHGLTVDRLSGIGRELADELVSA